MNNYNRIARNILGQVRQSIRGFCCSVNISPSLLMTPAIDDKGLLIMPPSSSSSSSSKNINKAADAGCFNMYNLIEKKMISVPKLGPGVAAWKVDILCPENALCVGSSHGWLAFLNPQNQSMFLLNPVNNNNNNSLISYIPLPPVETFPGNEGYRMFKSNLCSANPSLFSYFVGSESGGRIQKLVLSMPPSRSYIPRCYDQEKGPYGNSDSCFVAVLKDGNIFFCPLGGKEWYELKVSEKNVYEDIIYSPRKKTLFAIQRKHYRKDHVDTWDFTDPLHPKMKSPITAKKKEEVTLEYVYGGYSFERNFIERTYLVESQEGDMFQVIRYVAKGGCERSGTSRNFNSNPLKDYLEMPYRTVLFDVYKLVKDTWKHLKSLGDHRAIFVGINNSCCINTTGSGSCSQLIKGNCIYYSDDANVNCTIIKDTSDHDYQRRGGGGHDFGVFDYGAYKNVVDEDQHLMLNNKITSIDVKEFLSPPVWVIPASSYSDTFIPNSCYNCIDDKNKCVYVSHTNHK